MNNLNKLAANKGLVIAAINIFLQLIMYYTMPQLSTAGWMTMVVGILSLAIYIYFTIDLRKQIGGFWPFSVALKGILIMSLLANFVSATVVALFYKFIETGAYQKMEGYALESSMKTFEGFGMSQEQIDVAMVDVQKQVKATYDPTLIDYCKTLGILLIIAVVMSLIFAAIFKKNAPVFITDTEE